jgi:hypothetical protein
MSHVVIRDGNGLRHEVDFGEAEIAVSLHVGTETIELAVEADDPDRPSHKRRFALMNIPRHLFSKAIADLARQDRQAGRKPKP